MEVDNSPDAAILSHRPMIDHVFLPRTLPQKPIDLHNTERNLLNLMTATIESLENGILPSAIRQMFINIRQLHCIDLLDPKKISKQMKNLKIGDMMGVYVREQNCGLFIHRSNDDEVTISTFSASLPNEMIYGDTINGDIQVDYPTRAIKVTLSTMLKSEEFAKQIHYLNRNQMGRAMPKSRKSGHDFDEQRNIPHPMYVSQWLTSVVSDRSTKVNEEYPVISKKMRDEVIMGQGSVIFRRSGFYIAMKVFLQLGLTIELGAERAKLAYKLVMLKFMRGLCEGLSVDADIAVHMLAKMARRMEKIRSLDESVDQLGNKLIAFKDFVITDITKTIQVIRDTLNANFDAIRANEHRTSTLPAMPRLQFEQDINHLIPKLLAYIAMRNTKIAPEAVDNYPKPRRITRHAWQNMAFPAISMLSQVTGEIDVLQLLADFEHWILIGLDENYRNLDDNYLRQLATAYMSKALPFYQNDCFGYSKMVLVMLKIIQVMDMTAVEQYNILRAHSSGINPKTIENLLLPSQFHLKIAMKLQIYFEERNAGAQYPGLLEENSLNRTSFSVRFAERHTEMQNVRREILAMAERKIAEKRIEYDKARAEVADMRSRHSRMTCSYYTDEDGDVYHSRGCGKCSLQSQISNYKVEIYERPLKPEEHNQNGVVFELRMPPKIECLRDVLHLFISKHYESSVGTKEMHGTWTNYGQISQYNRSNPQNVFLGSTTKLVKNSHYGNSKHPDNPFSEFVLDNGYNCSFFGGTSTNLPTDKSQQSVKKYVTFSVESQSLYSGLQWTLSSTSHTQNSVLTKQCDCPEQLSLNEFVNFGSLRADGHRLQLRHLYRVLETEGLSLETQSVLALVMQSLWEAGSLDAARLQTKWYREAHEDFADAVFAMAMVELLEKYVEQQASNWKHPLKLLVVATIAVKVFEINDDESKANKIVKLLIRIREIVIHWISQIIETIGRCHDEASRSIVYANLVDAAICGVFTYNVSRHHPFFNRLFTDGAKHSSLFAWLQLMVTINNNFLLRGNKYGGIKRLLIRMVYNIAVNAEAQINIRIENNPEEVYKFVRFQWSESRTQTFEQIQHCEYSPQIIFMAVRSEDYCNYVQIDLISGEFLVNNLPVARLPTDITNHALFQRVFGGTIFEVQPSNRSYSTVYQYNGFCYIFRMENGRLIITEQRPDSSDRELIPPEILTNEIPYLLIENFSHWWDKENGIMEFRPKTFGSQDFSTRSGVQYELDLGMRHLKHLKLQKLLLDICSQSYQRIAEFLSRLEQKNYIHVLMDTPARARVHLMRMDLKFVIDCTDASADTYDVESNEYCGMRVSLDQTFDTLIGLQNGLLLEAMPSVNKSNSKMFIVPHGQININKANRHVSVQIDLQSLLRKPPFFIFHVDNELRQIKANSFPGWFYLAYLHAVTSYPLPDPFTGISGTERALQILQSARVWSSSPYDVESANTLRLIAALIPVRTFYPSHLRVFQQIQWPAAISSTAAQDSYLPIVRKLISDSQRLSQLHFQTCGTSINSNTNSSLNERDRARHLPYNPNFNILDNFIRARHTITRFQATEDDNNVAAVRQLSTVYAENEFVIPGIVTDYIYNFLTGKEALQGVSRETITDVIDFVSSTNLANMWIRLYDCACFGRLSREHFQLILDFLAYEGNDIDQLFILQTIAANAREFATINPPEIQNYCETGRHRFERETVRKIIKSTEIGLDEFLEEKLESCGPKKFKRLKSDFKSDYKIDVSTVTRQLTDYVERLWPCDEVGYTNISSPNLNVPKSIKRINPLLRMWNNNRKLVLFIREVETKLKQLNGATRFSPAIWPVFNIGEKSFPKYQINFEEKLSRNFIFPPQNAEDDIERARQIFVERSAENAYTLTDWWQRFEETSVPTVERHLVDSGLYPRLIPSLILPKLLQPISDEQKFMIGAIAVMTTREQRVQRIGRFEHQPQMELVLRREHENHPHDNWMPYERPEWLLFEIEMDLSIRRVQVDIAERMIEPPGNHHSVMQLNMGEGKTAVIVPILAAVLADGNQLCTVTVLRSLFQTNLRSLRQCLGGMLNQRIYIFPCRRDMPIEAVSGLLLSIYEECKRERGVVMTLPEYRLSFQLKIYEAARKGDTASATNFLKIHKWLNQNARHILDESDAILDAKYQLIYTVGVQLPPDGVALRWTVVQAVLKRVPHHMRRLFQMHGEQAIEFEENYQIDGVDYGHGEVANRPEVFRPCRLLSQAIYGELSDALIEDFLNGELNILFPETPLERREQIRNILRDPNISREQHAAVIDQFGDSPKKILLILSGLFKFGVLKLALQKRWRVNYGVNSTGSRKMAVPFRAKDVAAEMTEFGHPDVAICLTHFSYYYSGLTDAQLYESFNVLALTENPKEIYNGWIRSIPQNLVPASIASYNGINLSDPGQRDTQLFPLLRFNMHVIDYWLSNRVFPREAKIFEGKLMCTAWDLCTEHLEHVVTGFSGTNDTKLVLPMPIVQNDLPELEATNENVRRILLREENDHYRRLRSNVSGMEILHQLVADGIPVLLDAGALMLELDNEQAARAWLNLVSVEDYDAAIFFSKGDILMTVDRNDFITEFEYSVYRERLSRCLVYLDDVHTRGTDLKFPSGIRACVTLCGRITRDKTVQACMRMRMLGQGHMVSFYASLEADIGIRELSNLNDDERISTMHVVQYICNNSQVAERDGLVHWAAAGLNYTQKLAAHKCCEESMALSELSGRCTDPENTPLIDMYGAKEAQVLSAITRDHFNRIADIYSEQQTICSWIQGIGDGVVVALETYIPEVVRYTQLLDEEQEKELEHELEEQREVFRPPPIPSVIPELNPLLRKLFTYGKSHNSFDELRRTNGIRKLPMAFARSALYSIVESQVSAWSDNIFVTADFVSVAQLAAHDRDDEFIRPVWWIARVIDPNNDDVFVLLSTFECNALLPTFRSSKASILHMFCPKLAMLHSNLLNDANLQVPANVSTEYVDVAKAVQVAMFAGSMYFNDQSEEIAYCNFMGFIPRPRIADHQQAFEEGAITSNGYVPVIHRQRFAELAETCRFTENPDRIAIGIISRRHGYLSAHSHVSSLLVEGKRVRWSH